MGKILTILLVILVCTLAFLFFLKEAIVERFSNGNEFRYTYLYLAVMSFLGFIIGSVLKLGGRKK